jgi:hypothetical protein
VRNLFLALVVGYVVGAKTGGKEMEDLGRSLNALLGTEEFADVVTSARAQLGSTLRELASLVGGEHRMADAGGDLVAQVRSLVAPD